MKHCFSEFIKKWPIEGFFWLGSLIILFLYEPTADHNLSFCAFSWTGLDFCPGCGLGRSITYFLHGNPIASLASHPFGIPAVFILSHRIFILFRNHLIKKPYVKSIHPPA